MTEDVGSSPDTRSDDRDEIESILEEIQSKDPADRDDSLEEACAAFPDLADRLREAFSLLSALGAESQAEPSSN